MDLSRRKGFECTLDDSFDDIDKPVEGGVFDILHISSHGEKHLTLPDLSKIYLEKNLKQIL
jgi:hypothetical protein